MFTIIKEGYQINKNPVKYIIKFYIYIIYNKNCLTNLLKNFQICRGSEEEKATNYSSNYYLSMAVLSSPPHSFITSVIY